MVAAACERVESGMLREISLGGGERLYDPNFLRSPHHNHLICVDCRKIVEFEDPNIDIMQNCITRRLGFSPTQKAIRIEGSCDMLRLLGTCKNFKGTKGTKGIRGSKVVKDSRKKATAGKSSRGR